MSYIVKNCPAIFYSGITDEAKCWQKWEQFDESCQGCTDCVIKQVIEKCKYCYNEVDKENDGFYSILQLFDIEEINK